jgi:hypothetical protein
MNKYRPGGRCGGDTPSTQSNPEFNSSLASLLQRREQQDALFAPVAVAVVATAAKPTPQKKELVITQTTPKVSKEAYIQLLLEGDYEES